jgi:diamine N-acetyltransferase
MKRPLPPFGNGTVRLRLAEAGDLPMTLAWRNREDARVWFKTSAMLAWETHLAWFERYLERDDDFLFIVEAGGRPVGQASAYGIDWATKEAEIGRFLAAPEAAGKGYIAAACAELLRFCAAPFGLRYLFLEVLENNQRAIRIYRRNGFAEESRRAGLVRMGLRLPPANQATDP